MKTAEEYCDDVAKHLYMGTVPDVWNLMAKAFIVQALRAYADERLEAAAQRLGHGPEADLVRVYKSQP